MTCNNCAKAHAQFELRRGLCLECTSELLDRVIALAHVADGDDYADDVRNSIDYATKDMRREPTADQL